MFLVPPSLLAKSKRHLGLGASRCEHASARDHGTRLLASNLTTTTRQRRRSQLSCFWQPLQKLVERNRIVAHAHAGSVVDRVGNGRTDPANTKLADALGFHRRRSRIDLIKEDHLLVRDIRVYWHFVAGEIMIDKKTEALVDHQFLHQRRADAHRHRPDHLAARRLRIENAAGGAYREHPAHPYLGGGGIDANLDETDPISSPMKAKGVGELGICGVAAAVANAVYNATGVRVRDYPITLDKLIAGMPVA